MMKKCRYVIRSSVSFDILDEELGDLGYPSHKDEAGDAIVWPTLEVQSQVYWKSMLIWKNKIKWKDQVFAAASDVKTSIWKCVVASRFEYNYVRNCHQCITLKCIV